MNIDQTIQGYAEFSDEELDQFKRERWAPILASTFTLIHFLAGLFLLGWNYMIVPRAKQVLDRRGQVLSDLVVSMIQQSDFVVNYWYIFVVIGPQFSPSIFS